MNDTLDIARPITAAKLTADLVQALSVE